MSIPRTSLQSKSSRLALAATGAAAAVAVLVSGGVAAASGGPAPGYRLAAGGPGPAAPLVAGTTQHPGAAGRATAAGRQPATGQGHPATGQGHPAGRAPAGRAPAGQHQTATHRKPAGRLRLSFGDRLAGATHRTSSRPSDSRPSGSRPAGSRRSGSRPGQHATLAHRGHTAPAHARRAPARHHASVCSNSALHWWICHVERVLERHGVPRHKLDTGAAYIVVRHESGGNPHAYNGWDINAAQGHPSEGIAQVIGPTFHSYALPGYGNIWNPVDNMIAAFRYAISRYGSMHNIPGVVAVRHGGSYVGY